MEHFIHELRVVRIAAPYAIKDYPECVANTAEFPHLVKYVEDDMEIFVIGPSHPNQFWRAKEFFLTVDLTSFFVATGDWEHATR